MKTTTSNLISSLVLTLFAIFTCSWAVSAYGHEHFLECLDYEFKNFTLLKNTVYTPRKSYRFMLESPVQNLRFKSESTPKQLVVVTPEYKIQIPLVIRCAEENGLQIRVRSGGHALEGLSDVSEAPFVILDMIKLGETAIDAEQKTARVRSGATLGSLFYGVAERRRNPGLPGGR